MAFWAFSTRAAWPALLLALLFSISPACASECLELWIERNSLIDQKGYCFGTELGQTVFDNSDCFTKAPLLTDLQKQKIRKIRFREDALNCTAQQILWKPGDVVANYKLSKELAAAKPTTEKGLTAEEGSIIIGQNEATNLAVVANENTLKKDAADKRRDTNLDLRQLSGVWLGAIKCGAGMASYNIRLTFGSDVQITRHATLSISSTTNEKEQTRYTGSILYDVQFQLPSGKIFLEPKFWLNKASHPSFQRPFVLKVSEDGDSLTADLSVERRKYKCVDLVAHRTEESIFSNQGIENTISNSWFGQIDCSAAYKNASLKHPKFVVSIDILSPAKDELFAIFETMTEYGEGYLEAGGKRFVGETARNDRTVLNFAETRGDQFGHRMPPVRSFQFDTKTGEFSIKDRSCEFTNMHSAESVSDLHVLTHQVALPAPYYLAETDRDRCEVLIEWADKIDTEFHDINFGRSTDIKDTWRLAIPLADNDYVAVFGIPFDKMNKKARDDIWNQMNKCRSDPFTRDRIANVHRILYATASGNLEVKYMVRQIRMLRNAAKTNDNKVGIAQLKDIGATLSKFPERLWPSEYEAVKNSVIAKAAKSCVEIEQTITNENGQRLTKTVNTCNASPVTTARPKSAKANQDLKKEETGSESGSVLIVPVLPRSK